MNKNNNLNMGIKVNVVYGNPRRVNLQMPRSNIARPPAKYSNTSWDETVDKYAAIDIPPLKKKGGKK